MDELCGAGAAAPMRGDAEEPKQVTAVRVGRDFPCGKPRLKGVPRLPRRFPSPAREWRLAGGGTRAGAGL